MSTAEDLAKQIKQADSQKRDAQQMAMKHKDLLRQTIADLDKQISTLQTMRSKAASDLSMLA